MRQGDPGVAGLLPHRDGWRREIRVSEVADGNSDVSGKAFVLPVDGGAACRAKIKGKRVAAFGCPHPRRSFTGDGDLLTGEARLVANHGASAALALQAVAHGDARWFALNRKVKLSAGTGGASCHRSAPWLSIWCQQLAHRWQGVVLSFPKIPSGWESHSRVESSQDRG